MDLGECKDKDKITACCCVGIRMRGRLGSIGLGSFELVNIQPLAKSSSRQATDEYKMIQDQERALDPTDDISFA